MTKQRVYLLALTIQSGIIQVVNADGTIGFYRQRGIQKLGDKERKMFIQLGFLNPGWAGIPELPSNVSVYFEDEYIQGKARMTFPRAETLYKEIEQMRTGCKAVNKPSVKAGVKAGSKR